MPLKEEEMDELLDLASKKVFEKMENGKFYSPNEISTMLVDREIFSAEAIKKYVKEREGTEIGDVLAALWLHLWDIAYVESFLWSYVAVGKLRMGFKDDLPYYAKK